MKIERYRTIDRGYGLRITCWHGAVGRMEYPDRATITNWEFYAWLNPCKWVPACPQFDYMQDSEARHARYRNTYTNLLSPNLTSVKAERERRQQRKKKT